MRRRGFFVLTGLVAGSLVLGGGAIAALLRRAPDAALETDPEMREFAYSDGWIIPVNR